MPILTTQFNDLVRNALITWRSGFDLVPEAARQMYDIIDNPNRVTDYSSIDNAGFARRKDQGGSYVEGNPVQGYSMTLTKSRIGLMASITWEMRKYDKYREIEARMKGLGESTATRIELDLTHQFTFSLQGTSYTNIDGETVNTQTGDALAIFSNSHTITGSATTNDNLAGTTAFSRTGLEEAERLFNNLVNNNDVKVVPKPDTIITSDEPAMVNAVGEFLKSVLVPDTADNATNVYKAKYRHLVLPYLATTNLGAPTATGRFYWMLADLAHKDAICEFSENPNFIAGTPTDSGGEFDTDDIKFKSAASYSYGVLDYKWICGSAATTV